MIEPLERLLGSAPDGIVPLLGYREWALSRDGEGAPQLRSLFHPTAWPADRPLRAACLRPMIWHGRSAREHRGVPDVRCECGIYAFRDAGFDTLRGAEGPKARGIVRGWGRFVLGTSGWRCEFARIVAVLLDDEDLATSREIARRYEVPTVRRLDDEVTSLDAGGSR